MLRIPLALTSTVWVSSFLFLQTELRLAGGTARCTGRVEIFHNQRWGAVCEKNWDMPDAQVVCREVGCGDAVSTPAGETFGRVSGPAWMDQVNCTGHEDTLSKCPAKPLGEQNCGNKYAGVTCAGKRPGVREVRKTPEIITYSIQLLP